MKPNPMLAVLLASVCLIATPAAFAQMMSPPADVLNLDVTVNTEVAPDLGVVTLAAVREGPDAALLTQEVNRLLGKALTEAKATPGIEPASGGYSTWAQHDQKGQRTGWQVRGELILKSKDFVALGRLAGKLSTSLQITGNRFEVSPQLRKTEEARLIQEGVAAFRDKATATAKAFGYSDFTIREVAVGQAGLSGGPQPVMLRATMAMKDEAAPMPIEGGRVTLQLSVNGSVLMKR